VFGLFHTEICLRSEFWVCVQRLHVELNDDLAHDESEWLSMSTQSNICFARKTRKTPKTKPWW